MMGFCDKVLKAVITKLVTQTKIINTYETNIKKTLSFSKEIADKINKIKTCEEDSTAEGR